MKNPRSFIFTAVAKALFFLLNVFALYLLLRGHNLPGGGFIAGLVAAISIVMLSLALGWEETHRILRVDPAWFAVIGLMLATVSGAAPLLWGHPFLEQFMVHAHVPLLGEVHIGTPLVFDAGVLMVVIGITSKILFVLGKSTEGLRGLVREEESRYASAVEEPIEEEQPHFEEIIDDERRVENDLSESTRAKPVADRRSRSEGKEDSHAA